MAQNPHTPEVVRLVHGMEHAGLRSEASRVERSREFKRCFVDTVSEELGWREGRVEIRAGDTLPGVAGFLASFGGDGHPPEEDALQFVEGIVQEKLPSVTSAELVRDCCVVVLGVWYTCGGYVFVRDGRPWTIEAAVAEYESRHEKITDAAVRAELAAIRVYVQIEWEIAL